MVVDVGANTSPVLFASASIDITKEIVKVYDKSSAGLAPESKKPLGN
jgi:hypothetical protein